VKPVQAWRQIVKELVSGQKELLSRHVFAYGTKEEIEREPGTLDVHFIFEEGDGAVDGSF
jgi:hypothetical protein